MMKLKLALRELFFLLPGPLLRAFFNSKFFMKFAFGGRFAISDLDLKLEPYLGFNQGFFIEIGGNDGFSQSNTKHLELFREWTGVLVEPYKKNWKRMLLTRKKSSFKFHGACVPNDFVGDSVSLTYSNLMTVSDSLDTDLPNRQSHADSGKQFLTRPSEVRQFIAPALTLTAVLDKSKAPYEIDFLSLDVEGAEIPVLRGLDFEKYRIRFILVETRSPELMESFLNSKGYVLEGQLTHHDFLFRDVKGSAKSGKIA
jgi:FkbM family methyltransferase